MYRTSEKTSLSRKMAALEDRWRKSQEDRYILELKFKEVLKGLADKHEGNKLLKIREKYNRFLENEDSRNERNDRILRTLDKIESQANMLSAKTERLKLLKLHYEAYMKRMYPTWKEEMSGGGNIENKEPVQSVNQRYEQKHVSYSTSKEDMDHKKSNYKSPYHPPRNSEKSIWNHNNTLHELDDAPQTRQNPNYQLGNIKPRYTNSESNVIRDLNREFAGVDMNSEEKTSSSHVQSAGHEENTSKDLLNVSLSDDNVINDSTAPIEVEKPKGDFKGKLYSNLKPTEKEKGHPRDLNCHVSTNSDCRSERGDNSNEYLSQPNRRPGNNNEGSRRDGLNEYSQIGQREEYNSNADYFSPEEARRSDIGESRVSKDDSLDFNPSVVVTQPTPDIGKSSSEEDVSGQGIPGEDNNSKRHRNMSSHETSGITSEAEVSEVEVIASESGDEFRKQVEHSADVPESLRLASALGNNQGNLEESYQFSSSDADYDELENQMAALVEGKRNDESDAKDLCQSMGKSSINSINVSPDAPAFGVNEIGSHPLDTTEEETKVAEDVTAGFDAEEGSYAGDKIDSVDSHSETGGQIGYIKDQQQNLRSDELGGNLLDRENVREIDRQSASYESDECEKNAETDRSMDYSKSDEDGVTNTNMNAERINESYDMQDVKMKSDDSFLGESKEPEEIEPDYLEQEENVERQNLDKDLSDGGYVNQGDPNTELEEEFETEQGGDENNVKYSGNEGLHDEDINYQVEQIDYSHSTDEQLVGEILQEHRYSDGETEDMDGRQVKLEYDGEPQGKLEEEGSIEEISDVVNEEYEKINQVVEGIESGVDDQNLMEGGSEETEYQYKERIDEEEGNYAAEDVKNRPEELEHERYETIEEQRDEEYYQQNVVEEQGYTHDRSDLKEESEPEGQEEYERREMERDESAEVIDTNAEVTSYVEDEEGRMVENSAVYPPEGSNDTRESYEPEQESRQYESYQREEENVEEMQNSDIYEEEKVQNNDRNEEEKVQHKEQEKQHSLDTAPEVEEGNNDEQTYEERKDDLTPEPELPVKEIALEKTGVVRDDDYQIRSHETKKTDGRNRSETPTTQADVAVIVEGKKTNQNAPSKEQSKVKKPVEEVKPAKEIAPVAERSSVEKVERAAKETPHVPSRPLSRQSTRKDGSSQDAYKGEKLKTAVRKFQAKKDSRQTARKPLDSRK